MSPCPESARSSESRAARPRGHIARAALQAIALQTAEVLDAMRADSGLELTQLRVDGAASRNNLLM